MKNHIVKYITFNSESEEGIHLTISFKVKGFFVKEKMIHEDFFLYKNNIDSNGRKCFNKRVTHITTSTDYYRDTFIHTEIYATLVKHIIECTTKERRESGSIQIDKNN